MSAAADDEKLAEVIDIHGAEGYGIYWIILEKIAFLMDGSNRTCARYSVKKWAKFCGKSPKVLKKFLETFQKLSLFNVEICEKNSDFLQIDCPNLLKYRDEYSKKSRQTPDNKRIESGQTPDQETETETETEKDIPQNEFEEEVYQTKKGKKLKGKRLESFMQFWEAFNYKKGKAEAADAWACIPELTVGLVNTICESARREASNRQNLIDKGLTPIYAQGWLTARRWEDEETGQTKTTSATLTAMPGAIRV
jgi:hypothetical protein